MTRCWLLFHRWSEWSASGFSPYTIFYRKCSRCGKKQWGCDDL